MAENCKPIYKNLNKVAATGEQRYAVSQWADQNCENEEYLKQEVERLDYLSSPDVRKRFNPPLVDTDKSYGFQINGLENTVMFNSDTKQVIHVDFSTDDPLDMAVSDCVIERYHTVAGNGAVSIHHRAVLPKKDIVEEDYTTANLPQKSVNAYWYVGFNKSKPYTLYPEWMKNPKALNIPSVVRAQTFKATKTGVLEAVSLLLEINGTKWCGWGTPLMVQIWPTKSVQVDKTKWDNKNKKSVPISGKETIHEPIALLDNGSSMTYHALAEASFDPMFVRPGLQTFVFDNPCNVTAGEYYAIVVLCPLAHWEQAPRIGGFVRYSNHKYAYGDAFLSEDNGRTFIRYGKTDPKKIKNKLGKYEPQDFAFECKIVQHHEEYVEYDSEEENYSYLYFKPIFTNPITGIQISARCSGWDDTDHQDGKFLEFEYSTTGNRNNPEDWIGLGTSRAAIEGGPTMLFLRAKMWQTSANNSLTPSIQEMTVEIDTTLPREMYVRTLMYNPKTTPMLGASVWGKVNAPFTCESSEVECSAELIQDIVSREKFRIITVAELDNYVELSEIDSASIIGQSNDDRCTYLVDTPEAIEALKKMNVYVKPYTYESDSTITEYLSFDGGLDDDDHQIIGGLKFSKSPAYPIIDCQIIPHGEEYYQSYGEWYDFKVDYDEDIITFDEAVILNMPVGDLSVSYNPVFIQGLSNEEMPFVLDYIKEDIQVTSDIIENRYITLRAGMVDPIKRVYLNKDTDNEKELIEDTDFTVDYLEKRIVFTILNPNTGQTVLSLNDIVTVVYTPNIETTGLAIGYYAKRKESALNKQCTIKPNYLEYKV